MENPIEKPAQITIENSISNTTENSNQCTIEKPLRIITENSMQCIIEKPAQISSANPIQNKRATGKIAEDLAIQYLERNGYALLSANWYFGHKELDIVVESKEYRVFIEVKSRVLKRNMCQDLKEKRTISLNSITPENKVNLEKKKSISLCASHFNNMFPTSKEIRFDIIAITQKYHGIQLMHFKNAFSPFYAINDRQFASHIPKTNRKRTKRWNVFYI